MSKKKLPYRTDIPPFVLDPKQNCTWDYIHNEEYKIPVNYGVGLKWKDKEGHQCESVLTEHCFLNGKRVAHLNESNCLGSIGAMHYYTSVNVDSLGIYDARDATVYQCGGYGPEKEKYESFIGSIRLNGQRRITKVERDMNGETIGKIGEWTYRFNTEDEAKAGGIREFKERFGPGWVLILNWSRKIVLATT